MSKQLISTIVRVLKVSNINQFKIHCNFEVISFDYLDVYFIKLASNGILRKLRPYS